MEKLSHGRAKIIVSVCLGMTWHDITENWAAFIMWIFRIVVGIGGYQKIIFFD